ncbi:UDP-glucose/GDP-mannose dehydrogenase family protein [Candidatus Giovannonibacteria bacterium]|nr:UDP-glucose/GDP-mannose dehydrogenase family protein [Candidatus Giovannonibacteria bacterium]
MFKDKIRKNSSLMGKEKKPVVGIIGIGMVGKEVLRYFTESGWKKGKDLLCFDSDGKKGFSDKVEEAHIIFICVPTPRARDNSCDTSIVEAVVKKYHSPDRVLVVKSTVEPGTVARLQKKYRSPILFNPEFLTESRAWEDFIKPDRQVVGHTGKSMQHAGTVLSLLPKAFFSSPGVLGTYDFVRINSSEAEMGKYGGNVFGAMKVSYANILADFSKALGTVQKKEGIRDGVRYNNVRRMVAHDARIGDAWMDVERGSYRGFAGYCLPKDLDAFIGFGGKLLKRLNGKKDGNLILLLESGINFLKAIRKYNNRLLEAQGLDVRAISIHDKEVAKLMGGKNGKKKSTRG